MSPSLNIAALTKRTGVPADTIRKWEQRYGVLRPQRTQGGQRRYSELDVARVEWLKARLSEGYRIGEAAALLGTGGAVATGPAELRGAILEATALHDVGTLTRLVDQTLALHSLDEAFASVLAPVLVEIGDRWEHGELTVGQEHLATGVVRAAVQRLLTDVRPSVRGLAVLACAPGEQHDVGLLMLGVLLRADGWEIAYLGPDTPVEEAASACARTGAALLCLSASRGATAAELERVTLPPPVRVVVGGRATRRRDAVGAIGELRRPAA